MKPVNKPMKMFSALAVAALLSSGAAFAATTPTAKPAATATPATAHSKHASAMHCDQEARARNLSGAEQKKFIKECKEGKTTG